MTTTQHWNPGDPYSSGGRLVTVAGVRRAPANSAPPEVLATVQVGVESISKPEPAGKYIIRFHAVDLVADAVGQILYTFKINGDTYIKDKDVFAATGQQKTELPLDVIYRHGGGPLPLDLSATGGETSIAAVSIWPAGTLPLSIPITDVGPGAQLTVHTSPLTGGIRVTWDWLGADPDWFTLGRDGIDSTGYGAWVSDQISGSAREMPLNNSTLINLLNVAYLITVTASVGGVLTVVTVSATPLLPTGFALTLNPVVDGLRAVWVNNGVDPASWSLTLTAAGTTPVIIGGIAGPVRENLFDGLDPTKSYVATLTSASGATSVATGRPRAAGTPGLWLSGSSGYGNGDGDLHSFGDWRGTPTAIAGNWADDNYPETAYNYLAVTPYANLQTAIDQALGGLFAGENWAQAVTDTNIQNRWIAQLQAQRSGWGARVGVLDFFIRFAHEWNGVWYPWSANPSSMAAFVECQRIFYGLKQIHFPEAKVVWNLNKDCAGQGFDGRTGHPGAAYVDLNSVDYYNQFNWVNNATDWAASILEYDGDGVGPKGLERHRQYAESLGLAMAIPEWGSSSNPGQGDAPYWFHAMHDYMAANAGTGPGQIPYDIIFNVVDGQNYYVYAPGTTVPEEAAQYVTDF